MTRLKRLVSKFSPHEKLLLILYSVVLLGLFLYSYTQIDLSLTFSRITFLRNLVKSFQYVGYFNRPLSAGIFVILLVLLYGFYIYFLKLAHQKNVRKTFVWTLVVLATAILIFSYNAFSYDLFNYMFDAKIVTHYYQSPYQHKALDYQGDPMLSFMRWTHRTYPYGPVWLVLTVPLSFLGFQYFIPTFLLFKLLIASSFLGSLYYIGKIFQKVKPEKEVFGLTFFGLHPLILIESLVSAHIDIVMIFFSIFALYLLLRKKFLLSFVLLTLSTGIKFATALLLPVFVWLFVLVRRKKTIPWNLIFGSCVVLMTLAIAVASVRTNFQPWYLILVLPFAVFLSESYIILIPSIIVPFFALLNYVPYLYLGNWDKPVPEILNTLNNTSYLLSIFIILIFPLLKQRLGKKKA